MAIWTGAFWAVRACVPATIAAALPAAIFKKLRRSSTVLLGVVCSWEFFSELFAMAMLPPFQKNLLEPGPALLLRFAAPTRPGKTATACAARNRLGMILMETLVQVNGSFG